MRKKVRYKDGGKTEKEREKERARKIERLKDKDTKIDK